MLGICIMVYLDPILKSYLIQLEYLGGTSNNSCDGDSNVLQ